MAASREAIAGWGGFVAFLACALVAALLQTEAETRAFSLIVGMGAGGMFGVTLALAVHLARSGMPGPVWTAEDPVFADMTERR